MYKTDESTALQGWRPKGQTAWLCPLCTPGPLRGLGGTQFANLHSQIAPVITYTKDQRSWFTTMPT